MLRIDHTIQSKSSNAKTIIWK